MPVALEHCVTRLLSDPDFKPKDPKQDKKSAAYAVCTASLNKAIENLREATIIIKTFEEDEVTIQ